MIEFEVDLSERMKSRIYSRFLGTNTESLALLISDMSVEFLESSKDTAKMLDIDSSEGANLDVIGDIVGIKRPKEVGLLQVFEDDSIYFKWDTVGQGWDDGLWNPLSNENSLDDVRYRILIKAKIFANYAKSTLSDIARFVELVVGADSLVWDGIGYVDLHVGKNISSWEQDIILKNAPVAAGIRIGDLTSSENNDALLWDAGNWDQNTWAKINQIG